MPPATGTVRPIKQNIYRTANNIYINPAESAEAADSIHTPTARAAKGRIIPTEGGYRASMRLVMPETAPEPVPTDAPAPIPAARDQSYRRLLDEKTLQALDGILADARRTDAGSAARPTGKSGRITTADTVIRAERITETERETLVHRMNEAAVEPIPASGITSVKTIRKLSGEGLTEMRMMLHHLNTVSEMKKATSMTVEASPHIAHVMSQIGAAQPTTVSGAGKNLTVSSSVSFRTLDDGADIIMLVPPVEADNFRAQSGYLRDLPPIEFRQQQEVTPPEVPKKPTLNEKMEQSRTVRTEVKKGFEDMSREDIAKLADKVYSQIESRLIRERRRSGF